MSDIEQRLQTLEQRVKKLERARRLTAAEALESYDALRRLHPSLTLPAFAEQYGLSVTALRKARTRQRKRDKVTE